MVAVIVGGVLVLVILRQLRRMRSEREQSPDENQDAS
jgi:hypothetical protein